MYMYSKLNSQVKAYALSVYLPLPPPLLLPLPFLFLKKKIAVDCEQIRLRNMANRIVYRLDPQIRNDLIAYRHREYALRGAIISTNEIMDDLRSRISWLHNQPLDHPNRDGVEASLPMLRIELHENAIVQQTIRQEVHLRRCNLAHWINRISNFRSSFPYCFACESVQEIDAVYTLKNRTVTWRDDHVFRIALLPPPPHATFRQLRDRARLLRLDVVILPL